MHSDRRLPAILALAAVTLIWAAPPLFQKYLLASFDNATQNFYRYLVGFAVSLPFLMGKLRERKLRLKPRHFAVMLLPSIPNIMNQFGGVECLKYLMPGFVSLLHKVGILFSFALSYWMFRDERWLFRSRMFLAGFVLAAAGSAGLSLLKPAGFEAKNFYMGVFWVLFCGPAWAFYSVMIKKTADDLGVNASFTLVAFWTWLGFLAPTAWEGGLSAPIHASWQANTVMVVSAVFAIGLAHPLYYYSVRKLGVSICQVVLLATPIPTILFSAWLFRESLTRSQSIYGAILLIGSGMACLARKPDRRDPAREIATATES